MEQGALKSEKEKPPEPIVISHGFSNPSISTGTSILVGISGFLSIFFLAAGFFSGDVELCCCGFIVSIPAEIILLAHFGTKTPKTELQTSW